MSEQPGPPRRPEPYDSSIGAVSTQVGYDVRELLMMGWTHAEIVEVEAGLRTLDPLLKSKRQPPSER